MCFCHAGRVSLVHADQPEVAAGDLGEPAARAFLVHQSQPEDGADRARLQGRRPRDLGDGNEGRAAQSGAKYTSTMVVTYCVSTFNLKQCLLVTKTVKNENNLKPETLLQRLS